MSKLTREDIATKIHRQYHPPKPRRVDGFGRVLEWEDETEPKGQELDEKIKADWQNFGSPGTKGGQYWGRRGKDSKIVRMNDAEAKKLIRQPAMDTKKDDPEWLAVYWVPPEYVKAGEAKFRIEKGWVRPLWDWGLGPQPGGVAKQEDVEQDLDERMNQSCFPKPNRSDPAAELAGWSDLAGAMVVAVPPKLRKAAQAFKKAVDFEFSHSDLYDDKGGDEGSLDEEGEESNPELLDEAKRGKLKKDIKLKTGDVVPAGTSVEVEFDRRKPERALLTLDFSTDNRDYTVDPLKMSAGRLYLYVGGFGKPPSIKTMMNWTDDGVAKSVTGKKVAPDGIGPDGSPSWLMVLGYV